MGRFIQAIQRMEVPAFQVKRHLLAISITLPVAWCLCWSLDVVHRQKPSVPGNAV